MDCRASAPSLTEALAAQQAGELPEKYSIVDDVTADAVTSDIAGLEAAQTAARDAYAFTAEQQAILDGAVQSDVTINVPYTLEDSLDNLAAAAEGIVAGADAYTLTDAAGDLGALSAAESALVAGAANADAYDFTVEVTAADIAGIEASAATVTEGNAITFTVTMNEAAAGDREVNFVIEGVETAVAGAASPVDDLGQKNGVVTIPAGETTATITLTPNDDGITEGLEAFVVKVLDGDFNEVTASGNVVIQDPANAGKNEVLTTGVDVLEGGAGNDTYTGLVDLANAGNSTLNALDSIDGQGGNDTLKLNVTGDAATDKFASIDGEIQNIENLVLRSTVEVGDTAALDLSGLAGLTNATVTRADKDLALSAADTTDFTVSGTKGAIALDGGQNIVVNDATADNGITIGATTVNNGTIAVTDAKQGTGAIAIDGGSDVTVNATSEGTGTITVGNATTASGAVSVTQNLESDATAALTGGDITVTGGTTIDVTVNANSVAEKADSDADITVGTIIVTGDDATTDVTVTQNDNSESFTKETEGQKAETAAITFGALKAGESVTVSEGVADGNDLTFTASKNLTAEEVAQAFADLTNADTQAAGGPVENGVFTGSLDAGWTSGAANGASVTFTATTTGAKTDLEVATDDGSGGSATANADFKVKVTGGVNGTAEDVSQNAVAFGKVTVADGGVDSIRNVTLDGYADGSTIAADALETLNIANSAVGADLEVATAATALTVNVDGVTSSSVDTAVVNLDSDGTGDFNNQNAATVTDLTLNSAGTASAFILEAGAVKNLAINAATGLDVSHANTDLSALEAATVAGAGRVALGDLSLVNSLKSVDASASTGGTSVAIDGSKATFTGGTGADEVTLKTGTALTKDITLGAGDDTVIFEAEVTGSSAVLDGGDGTDTLSMAVANAAALDGSAQTFYTNFERLVLNDAAGTAEAGGSEATQTVTIDLANLGFVDYVTTSGTNVGAAVDGGKDKLILDKLANAATVVLTANGDIQANVAGADTGAADSLNVVVTTATTDLDAGVLTVNDVETVNITSEDTNLDHDDDGIEEASELQGNTLALEADAATSVTVDGNANLKLNGTADELATVDASAMTGALEFTADAANTATTVTGGAGDDMLTAIGSGDVLIGGAGNDTLTGADLTQLTGGDGNDTFVMNTPSNVNSYSTITDLSAGDVILFAGADVNFISAGVELAATAVFQDYANAAANALGADGDDATWFQFGGNTYIVQSGNTTAGNDFVNDEDSIIQIQGEVDLSLASYNQTAGTLEIA